MKNVSYGNDLDSFYTAGGPNPDYGSVSVPLTFSSGVSNLQVNVSIIDDQIAEGIERFIANLRLISDNDRVSIAPNTATVNITDNDGEVIAPAFHSPQ